MQCRRGEHEQDDQRDDGNRPGVIGNKRAPAGSDALLAIYQIDQPLGTRYARQYRYADKPIAMIAEAILRGDRWLLEPTEE